MIMPNPVTRISVLFLSCMALLSVLMASPVLGATDTYDSNPGPPLTNPFNSGTSGPNPGTYGSFVYSYRNAARILVSDVYWWIDSGVGNTGNMSTDSVGAAAGTGRELSITKNGGGTYTFKGLTLNNFTNNTGNSLAAVSVRFHGYNGATELYTSGDVTLHESTYGWDTYTPASSWSGITELRIVPTNPAHAFDPMWDNFQYSLVTPPAVTTTAASGITATGATINGTVNANNDSTTVTFQYGLSAGYGSSATATQSPVTGTSNTAVSAPISGLTCGGSITYHFRVIAVNDGGTTTGSDATFTTGACAPTVTGISPTSGPAAGGTSVTITGTNLTGATAVTIGGAAATGVTVVNSTTITATSPAGTAGAKNVVVTTPGGTGTGTGLFTYTPPTATLTVTISGNGSVNSHNTQGTNYSCNSGTCSPVTFGYNDTLTLTPTGSNSTFSTWSGDYSGSSNPGSITLNANKAVTATFVADPARVRVEGDPTTRYYSLGAALAAPSTNEEIRAQGAPDFSETVISTNSHNLQLRGGFINADFSDVNRTGYSTLIGWLKIQAGKLTVERVKIKAP